MRIILFLVTFCFLSCQNHSFDSDTRQIIAKNEIRRTVKNRNTFDVLQFTQDTLQTFTDTTIRYPIRYTIDFTFKDSTGTIVAKKGEVIFAPGSLAVLSTHIK